MRILLTNDDGYHAPGLKVLEEIARQFSDDIWVCAPSEEQSGAGHSLTLTRPVRLIKYSDRRFAVTGTPTDSVMMALRTVMPSPPDIILSGVNRGANLGDDITYSVRSMLVKAWAMMCLLVRRENGVPRCLPL